VAKSTLTGGFEQEKLGGNDGVGIGVLGDYSISGPYRKFCAAYGGDYHSPNRIAILEQFVALRECGERNPRMHACARAHNSDAIFKGPRRGGT
jgi:hypothetical protein